MAKNPSTNGANITRRGLARLAVGGAVLSGAAAAGGASEAAAPVLEPTRLANPGETLRPEILGTFGIVAAGRHYTVAAGVRILTAGGNAFDAGVASVFAGSVTEISHFGFGGESPTIVYEAKSKKVSVINGQGFAPALATPAVFEKAGVIPGNGPNGGTIPAMVDAMCLTLQNFGTITLHEAMAPAIELADGFPMYNFLHNVFVSQQKATEAWGEWSKRCYYPDGKITPVGEMYRQPYLAKTMRIISEASRTHYARTKDRVGAIQAGRDAFYKGDIARRIGAAVAKDGGTMRYEDLAAYQGKIEAPVSTSFYGHEVYKAGFWNQGATLLMILNIIEAAGIRAMKPGSEEAIHTVTEAFKLAFDDRNVYFGDPDFVKVPGKGLLSKAYAAERAKMIGARASMEHRYGDPYPFDNSLKRTGPNFRPYVLPKKTGPTADTTAIEIVDKDGNLFSCTPSSGWMLGGAYVAGDTGVPLSNRMTIFDLDPQSPNVLAPHKRPRTTLSPSIVLKDGKPFLAIGTPGGDNQDQQIANVLINLIAWNMPLQQAIEEPRINSNHFHNSFGNKKDEPGVLEIENRVAADVLAGLTARGHKLDVLGPLGVSTGVVAVGVLPGAGTLRGGADVRRERYAFGW